MSFEIRIRFSPNQGRHFSKPTREATDNQIGRLRKNALRRDIFPCWMHRPPFFHPPPRCRENQLWKFVRRSVLSCAFFLTLHFSQEWCLRSAHTRLTTATKIHQAAQTTLIRHRGCPPKTFSLGKVGTRADSRLTMLVVENRNAPIDTSWSSRKICFRSIGLFATIS